MDSDSAALGPARQEQEGHRVGEALGHAAKGILSPRAALHGEYADLLAVVDAAVAVGHVDAGPLLAAYDRAYALLGTLLDQVLVWVGRHPLHTFHLQYLRYDSIAVQFRSP